MFYIKNTLYMVYNYFASGNMKRLDLKENIEKLIKSGKTYEVTSKELKDQHLDCRGLSTRSVRRSCLHYWKEEN